MRVTGLHPHKKQLQKTTGYYSEFIDPFDSFILAFDNPPPPANPVSTLEPWKRTRPVYLLIFGYSLVLP